MPITYDTPKEVEGAKTTEETQVIRSVVNTPSSHMDPDASDNVTVILVHFDANGNKTGEGRFKASFTDLAAKYGAKFTDAVTALKEVTYQEAVDQGATPSGGTVS